MTQASIEEACRAALARTESGRACGVVDLRQGVIVARHHHAQHPEALDPAAAAALTRLLRGPELDQLTSALRTAPRNPGDGEGPELHVLSETRAFFAKVLDHGAVALVLVADRTTTLGLGWACLKSLATSLEGRAT